ncbi:conjugative transposon protein TraM [Bacteroides fragilis]|uniref:conjugative transposon protein TraM n=1 Tax=Bacteroides fragilis TaxID=817 RepID=UPI0020304989|nr:conjugative transposon protein TraM [Bacteroides fragilis]MCM0238816.1 conjugative transposon protein TraM [Bacteroides fragilis]
MNLKELLKKKDAGDKPDGKPEGRKPLDEAQRIRRNKMIVFPLMGLLFAGSMWLIFAPSTEDKAKDMQGQSFNTEMPSPDNGGIIGDKQKAYEQARLEEKRTERNHEMQSLASLFNGNAEEETEEADYDLTQPETDNRTGGSKAPASTIRSSATAYHDINRTLGNFYEQPKEDSEKEELRQRVEELEAQAAASKDAAPGIDDQMALLERSYQLAAQYMPANGKKPTEEDGSRARAEKKRNGNLVNGKATVEAVSQVEHEVVTALAQPMSNAEFIAACSSERNYDFHTAVGTASSVEKNTIAACVHGNQTILDGQAVRLRLLERVEVADMVIPRNAVVVGAARIQGERLGIEITSLEYGGTIVPVELAVFDSDGQEGIFIPNSMEVSAAKEVAANMGSSLGSSINISTDAGAQLASDLGKGVIQGASQYIAKKMRTVKVHLKAGYRVMLYQPEN